MTNPTHHTPDVARALSEAVEALYFNDSSKYLGHLWNIVRHLGGEEAVELVSAGDGRAFHRYSVNRDAEGAA